MHGSDNYVVKYAKQVLDDDIPSLPKSLKPILKRAIEERVARNPLHYGKPLRYSWKGHRRIRVSDYRIVYRVDEEIKTVYIVAIMHRKDVYE